MSGREVLVEPEFDTQEAEDSVERGGSEEEREGVEEDDRGGSEEDDECLGAAALPPGAVGGRPVGGLGRKKRGGKKKKSVVNQFKADDDAETEYWTEGLNSVLTAVEQCAHAYFPGVQGSEHNTERRANLKKFHDLSVDIVGARMKLEQVPEVVQNVLESMNFDEVEDDEEFCKMLDQFGDTAMSEVDKLDERVTYEDAIKYDPNYNQCLEVLNKYQKKKGQKLKDEAVEPEVVDEEVDVPMMGFGRPGTSGQSQGLEALTEYVPTHDPVTRRVIENAVVSRKCLHVYDDKSIREFLREVGGVAKKCPYAGCKETVSVADLMVDAGMRRKVKQRIREEGLE